MAMLGISNIVIGSEPNWGTIGVGADQLPLTGGPCPGSPGCPGYVDPNVNAAIQAAIAQQQQQAAALAAAQALTPAVVVPGQWFPWVSNNTVLIGGAVVAGAIFLGRRR